MKIVKIQIIIYQYQNYIYDALEGEANKQINIYFTDKSALLVYTGILFIFDIFYLYPRWLGVDYAKLLLLMFEILLNYT